MQSLREHSEPPRRRWTSPWAVLGAVVVLLVAGGVAYAVMSGRQAPVSLRCAHGVSCSGGGSGQGGAGGGSGGTSSGGSGGQSTTGAVTVHHLSVRTTSPAAGSTTVSPDASLSVTFSSTLAASAASPTLTPPVPGTWTRTGDTLAFTPSAAFVPGASYTLTLPAGPAGVVAASGEQLARTQTIPFRIASGSTLRVQQLLATLGYLPLTYSAAATPVTPRQAATAQPGTLAWRWSGLPAQLTDQWVPGTENSLTKSAVMMFESQNSLAVDGLIGPKVWTALLSDVSSHRVNTEPLTYVLVTKALPQHLTAWVNGQLSFTRVPVNTGVRGATTNVGTFQVFEHVPFSDMRGTDVTGTKYTDPHVPWASYFNGGDALHGYPRATYGWPQSNGCVEMNISTAGDLWPDTPIGTLVTVQGPSQTVPLAAPAPTTTTTTKPKASAPTTTTTTKPRPTAPTTTTTTKPKPPSTTTTTEPVAPTTTTTSSSG